MKITSEQLAQHLKKELSPIYLIGGDEVLLIQETIQAIRTTAQQQGFTERKSWQINTSFAWEQFLLDANNLSLFSQKTLLELNFTGSKLNDEGKNALEIYSAHPPADKILLLITNKFDTKISNTNWFKQVEKSGTIIPIWPMDAAKFPHWIKQRLQQAGLTTDNAGIQLLAELTEGNLLATQQAIEKLRLSFTNKNISAEEIATTITDNARFDIFTLVDNALLGDAKKTVAILKGLMAEGTEPTIILWAVTREIRNLIAMANILAVGKSLEQILLEFRVWEKRKLLIKNVLKRHALKNLYYLLQQAAEIDSIIKGAKNANSWQTLLDLCLNLAGTKLIKSI